MIRFVLLAVSIYSITVQSCSSDLECAADPIYAAVAAQIPTESAVCDTSISQCTITCNTVDPCVDANLQAAVGFPLECDTTQTPKICVAAPTVNPSKSPSASPSSPPSKRPSASPIPGTGAPTISSVPPTASPSDVTSEPTLATSGPTPAPTCPATGLCPCTDDAPCIAAYGPSLTAQSIPETAKCDLPDGTCTITCANVPTICATANAFLNIFPVTPECNANSLCYIPPTTSPTRDPSVSPTAMTNAPSQPSIAPTAAPIQGTAAPTAPSASPTARPSTPPSAVPTKVPTCSATNPFCACADNAPCEASCTTDLTNLGEACVCNTQIGQCTATCATAFGPAVCGQLATDLGMVVECQTVNSVPVCVVITTSPTKSPTQMPSQDPSASPTGNPTRTGQTREPTRNPSASPSKSPSKSPTKSPTRNPTVSPSKSPSRSPTIRPTSSPTNPGDTRTPSASPTNVPTKNPSISPTDRPSKTPSISPTASPVCPTTDPSGYCYCDNDAPCLASCNNQLIGAGESCACVTAINQCTATCNNLDLCALIGSQLTPQKNLICVDGLCVEAPPTTAAPSQDPSVSPTESPTNVGDTRSPSKSPTMDPTISPTKSPTRSPTQRPTVPPTKSPTKSPTLRPTLNPSKPGDTRYPTKSPTPNPTKSPTKSPTSMPSTSPVEPCGLETFPAGACTCVDADTQPNCDILNADSNIQQLFASMDPPETIACDPLAEQCTVTCNTETTCATLSAMAGALFTEPLACDTERNLCVIVQPSASPTESPTDDNTDCLKDYYPYGADCAETEPEGCGLLFDATVDVCTLNMIFPQSRIGAIISGSVEEIVAGIATAKGICPAGVQQYILKSLAVNPRGNNAANAIARGNPQTAAACPALDDICKSENGGPGFELVAQVAVHCDTCEATKKVGQVLVDGGIKTGDYDTLIESKVNAMAASDDTVCEDGFGTVDIQSIDVVFVNLEGDQEVIVEDVGEDGAIQKYYAVAMTVVFMVCAWL